MHNEQPQGSAGAQGEGMTGRPRISRRQAMGRMSAVATAGAVAWVVPEILTAKPAAGAALSGTSAPGVSAGVSTSASVGGDPSDPSTGASVGASTNGPDGVATGANTSAAVGPPTSLAFTGLNIKRDAEVGAALVAGGWAMQHWASRAAKPAATGPSDGPRAESAGGGI